jgi:hypothetical protein
MAVEAKMVFSQEDCKWVEPFNLVEIAEAVFQEQQYAVTNEKTWLLHPESGFVIQPQLAEIHLLEDGGVRTVTTVQINHPTLVPGGVFEYQHSTGDTIAQSISRGIDQWIRTDFVPLREAVGPTPGSCTALVMEFPAREGKPARTRRAILGPVAHFMQQPPTSTEGDESEEHPFCPCCLLTRSFEAFREYIEGDGFYCLRLFALRDAEGLPGSDCRVNGRDWEKGAQALREYAMTWPAAGYEFRKQYVVLHTVEKGG